MTEKDKKAELHRDSGMWKYYMPVNLVGDVCCVCGEKITNDNSIEYLIESVSGIDYYQYHKNCLKLDFS